MRKPIILALAVMLALVGCVGPATQAPVENAAENSAETPAEHKLAEQPPVIPTLKIQVTRQVEVAIPHTGQGKPTPASSCSPKPLSQTILTTLWEEGKDISRFIPVNPENGLPVCNVRAFEMQADVWAVLAPQGKKLAVAEYQDPDARQGSLHLVDLESWQTRKADLVIDHWVRQIAFSPDGNYIAIALMNQLQEFTLLVLDTASLEVIARKSLDIFPTLLKYMQGGKSIAVFGGPEGQMREPRPPARALILDAGDLSLVWEQSLPDIRIGSLPPEPGSAVDLFDYWEPGIAFSREQGLLYIVHADEEKLTRVDFHSRERSTLQISPRLTLLERLLSATAGTAYAKALNGTRKQAFLSKDGTRLFVSGQSVTAEIDDNAEIRVKTSPLGLQVIDTSTGIQVARLDNRASALLPSPGGEYLYLTNWEDGGPTLEVVASEDLKVIKTLKNVEAVPTRLLNGKAVVLLLQSTAREPRATLLEPTVFDRLDFDLSQGWLVSGYPLWSEPW